MARSNGGNGISFLEALLGLGIGAGAVYLLTRSKPALGSPRRPTTTPAPTPTPTPTPSTPIPMGSYRYASWHPHFAPLVHSAVDTTILHSGCIPDADGNIQCAPETMRASAEKQLLASSYWPHDKPLDLATYTLARYMQSEIGNGTAEERVAVGEAAVNQAHRRGQDINALLLNTQPNHLYGEINVPGKGNVNHRWAATSHDPSILTTLLADLVMSGHSENISHGADDQDGLEFKRYFPVPMNRILSEASQGRYWVGPIPGVDHWKTTLFRTYGYKPDSPDGRQLIERARGVFGNPIYDGNVVARSLRPVWPANLPVDGSGAPSAPSPQSHPPMLSVDGERILIFGDSLSHPGLDTGPTVTDVTANDSNVALSSAPGAVLAASLRDGTHGAHALAVRINARVGRSARSFMTSEDHTALIANDLLFHPTKVIVMLGTNDIDRGVTPAALELTKEAMRQIRDAYRGMGADVIAIGPPSYPSAHYAAGAPAMLAAIREVFGAENTLDAQPLTVDAQRANDGVHFTKAGAIPVGDRLAIALQS